MVTRDQVVDLIKDHLEVISDIQRDEIALNTKLDAIDVDSLGKMELIFDLENRLKINIAIGLQDKAPQTVSDLADLVMRNASNSV